MTGLLSGPPIEWAPTLTLVLLLGFQPWRQFNPRGATGLLTAVYTVCLLMGILIESWSHSPALWFTLTGLHFAWIGRAYFVADNHHYLEGYWCLTIAIALTLGGVAGEQAIVSSAATLIGLCFLAALLAKALNAAYRDGTFFVHSLLFDPRFLPIARRTGLEPQIRMQHLNNRQALLAGQPIANQAPIPPRLRRLALLLTWWTAAIEMAIAVLFLIPAESLGAWRVGALLLFTLTTFPIVPVLAFGHILLIMVAVTSHPSWRAAIVAILVSLPVLSQLVGLTFRPRAPDRTGLAASTKDR